MLFLFLVLLLNHLADHNLIFGTQNWWFFFFKVIVCRIGRRMQRCDWMREWWIQQGVGLRNSNLEWKLNPPRRKWKVGRMHISLWMMKYLQMQHNRRQLQPSSILRTITSPKWSVCKIGRRGKFVNTYMTWCCEGLFYVLEKCLHFFFFFLFILTLLWCSLFCNVVA